MAEVLQWENIPDVVRGLLLAGEKVDAAALLGVQRIALEFQGDVKSNLLTKQNENKRGHEPYPGDGGFPNRRTGNLASSITISEPRKGFGTYTVEVGPTMVYARILELGFANGNRYPYMNPTLDQLRPKVNFLMVQALRAWKG